MDDLISRQAAIDALKAAYWDKTIQSAKDDPCVVDAMTDWAIRQIKALPSAQPERKKGTWGADGECPFCGYLRQWDDDNFCANCGARMDGESDE